jgi:hypothetical protein
MEKDQHCFDPQLLETFFRLNQPGV